MSVAKRTASIASLAVLCAIAVVSLLVDLRTDGRLNIWGFVALSLTGLSFLLGVSIEILGWRDESKHEKALSDMGAFAQAASAPLRPLSAFLTLRYWCAPEVIERSFAGVPGYKQRASDLLEFQGVVTLGVPGLYNDIRERALHSHCELDEPALTRVIDSAPGMGEYVVKMMHTCEVRFWFKDRNQEEEPDLAFAATLPPKPTYTMRLLLFDDIVYSDWLLKAWQATTRSPGKLSVADLLNARVELCLGFFSFQDPHRDIADLRLHNLNLYFGHPSPFVLSFNRDQLQSASVIPDPKPVARGGFFTPMILKFQQQITVDIYRSQIKEVSL